MFFTYYLDIYWARQNELSNSVDIWQLSSSVDIYLSNSVDIQGLSNSVDIKLSNSINGSNKTCLTYDYAPVVGLDKPIFIFSYLTAEQVCLQSVLILTYLLTICRAMSLDTLAIFV